MTQGQSQVKVISEAKTSFLTIYQFAQICNSTPRALRLYEKKGLIKPAKIDPYNSYRLYDQYQAREVLQIKLLQKFGLTLKEIKDRINTRTLQSPLEDQLKKLKEDLEEKQKEYEYLQGINKTLIKDNFFKDLFKEENVPETFLFCVKIEKGEYRKIKTYVQELKKEAKKLKLELTGEAIIFYLNYLYRPKGTPIEVALVCKSTSGLPLQPNFYFKSFPYKRVISTNFSGPTDYLPLFYKKLYDYMDTIKANKNTVFEKYNFEKDPKSIYDKSFRIGFAKFL